MTMSSEKLKSVLTLKIDSKEKGIPRVTRQRLYVTSVENLGTWPVNASETTRAATKAVERLLSVTNVAKLGIRRQSAPSRVPKENGLEFRTVYCCAHGGVCCLLCVLHRWASCGFA